MKKCHKLLQNVPFDVFVVNKRRQTWHFADVFVPIRPMDTAREKAITTSAEVIILSKELGAGLVIIDKLTARKVAIMMGLPVIMFDNIAQFFHSLWTFFRTGFP